MVLVLRTFKIKTLFAWLRKLYAEWIENVMDDWFINSDENKKLTDFVATRLYGRATNQYLPYGDIKITKWVTIKAMLTTNIDSETGLFVEVDLIYLINISNKTKRFPICAWSLEKGNGK